jgi:hypothetical protein
MSVAETQLRHRHLSGPTLSGVFLQKKAGIFDGTWSTGDGGVSEMPMAARFFRIAQTSGTENCRVT